MAINILVTEDESIVRKDIVQRLKKLGYNVVAEASSGETAIELAEKTRPDIAIMDIRLNKGGGKIDGIEASREIKKAHDIPVIFLTANADDQTISEAKLIEPHGYILKPFEEVDIKTTIEMAIHKHKKEQEIKDENDLLKSLMVFKRGADYIFVKEKGKFKKIEPENMYFIEALKDYVTVYLKDKKYVIHITMKELVKKLPEKKFQRVHRSFIVNMDKVSTIYQSNLNVEGFDIEIPIGGSYKKSLAQRINVL
jgi:DNA-binding LytR/AlgR family response regulator